MMGSVEPSSDHSHRAARPPLDLRQIASRALNTHKMDSNVLIEAERIALLSEIASLEQQIASLSNDKQERLPKRPRPAEDEGAEQGIEETMWVLL